jgi:hypothetical protein
MIEAVDTPTKPSSVFNFSWLLLVSLMSDM